MRKEVSLQGATCLSYHLGREQQYFIFKQHHIKMCTTLQELRQQCLLRTVALQVGQWYPYGQIFNDDRMSIYFVSQFYTIGQRRRISSFGCFIVSHICLGVLQKCHSVEQVSSNQSIGTPSVNAVKSYKIPIFSQAMYTKLYVRSKLRRSQRGYTIFFHSKQKNVST